MFGTGVEISVFMRIAQNVCRKPMIGTDVLSDQISVPWLWLHFGILWRSETCLYSTEWFHLDHKASL